MNQPKNQMEAVFLYDFTIPESALDENGYVNNVMYVQWMQYGRHPTFQNCSRYAAYAIYWSRMGSMFTQS